ncbi:hypothetical protein MTO96_025319 [Rhipicephalus appendiculatus]
MNLWTPIAVFVCVGLELVCAVNETSFSKENCELDPDPGICRGMLKQWFYNSTSFRCETFYYGGCLGNANKFDSLAECNRKCREYVPSNCAYPIKSGHSCANGPEEVVFGYNTQTRRCERFVYSGCGGYPNKFRSAGECWKACGQNSGSKCMEPGPKNSLGLVKKYYYDIQTDSCKTSRYSPFSSKMNRFDSLADCEKECKGKNKF